LKIIAFKSVVKFFKRKGLGKDSRKKTPDLLDLKEIDIFLWLKIFQGILFRKENYGYVFLVFTDLIFIKNKFFKEKNFSVKKFLVWFFSFFEKLFLPENFIFFLVQEELLPFEKNFFREVKEGKNKSLMRYLRNLMNQNF